MSVQFSISLNEKLAHGALVSNILGNTAAAKPECAMSTSLCQRLHDELFPDAVYQGELSQQQHLIARLRQIANDLESALELNDSSNGHDSRYHARLMGYDRESTARIATSTDAQPSGTDDHLKQRKRNTKEKRDFDMDAYQRRYVALEVFYLGWRYHGFASQADSEETVEGHLFRSMRRTKLIPERVGWEGLGYSRCGRTDKGVSALGQVVALWLRSGAKVGEPALDVNEEMDYAVTLNRALPDDIRVLGWTPVPETFSARFSAVHREYKYYIVQRGDLDLAAMQEAAGHFTGDHDFRNFCKVDAQHVSSFRRTILDFRIAPVGLQGAAQAGVYALHVRGTAFLWHQVRCMAAVLLLVGRGLESPDVVHRMLDVDATPLKPQYNMAPEEPLLFYACVFNDLPFRRSAQSHAATRAAVQCHLDRHLIALALLQSVSDHLTSQAQCGVAGTARPKSSKHVPLLKRATEPAVEERLTKYGRQIKSRDAQTELTVASA